MCSVLREKFIIETAFLRALLRFQLRDQACKYCCNQIHIMEYTKLEHGAALHR